MAERIVAPGVYTKEIDQSFLPGAIAQIGAAIVGPTTKGPALVPTQITSFSEFSKIFGTYSDESYVPYAVNEYLKNGGNVITVTRLLYEDGYNYQNGVLAVLAKSGSGATAVNKVTHILHPTNQISGTAVDLLASSSIGNASSGSFSIKLSGSYTSTFNSQNSLYPATGVAISASINPSANNYVTKIFGTSPKSSDYPVYVQYEDKNAYATFAGGAKDVTIELAKFSNYSFAGLDYSAAATPWITSQKIGTTTKKLFRFYTLSHGTSVNHEVKVGIRDIKTSSEVTDPDGYPTFVVDVRRVNTTNISNTPYISSDTDQSPDLVEQFVVNLNPDSSMYIANVIGNRYGEINSEGDLIIKGDYPSKSSYIRVLVDESVETKNNDKSLFPFGFDTIISPIPNASGSLNLAAVNFVSSQTNANGIFSKNTFHGFDFSNTTNLEFISPLPHVDYQSTGSNVAFYLGNVSQSAALGYKDVETNIVYSGSLADSLIAGRFEKQVALSTRKFIVPFQGGFDGARPNLPKYSGTNITAGNTFGFDCTSATSTGTVAYAKAFSLLANTDYYDINLLLTPGIIHKLHPDVTLAARTLVEDRQDTFYVMDGSPAKLDNIDVTVRQAVDHVSGLDSNYTATYFPWVRIKNPVKGTNIWAPPSVVMPGVLAFNDVNAAPWYAPAGLTRGGLTTVSDTYLNLSQTARGTLYEARINPIANFPSTGIAVWGQKTLQARQSALDRVNVRRLLIAVKKYIASSTRFLVFEQNTEQTRKRFLDIVNPYLSSVARNQGLYAFKVIMDESNNTNDLVDQNILYGQLFLQPTRTAEFILLDFNIQPTGASFPE